MRDKKFLVFIIIISLVSVTLYPLQSAKANTYVVTNTNNSGSGSLRQAITDANSHPGADVITFAASTDGTPIVLAGTSGEDANVTGDLDILDGGDLTIQGNGPANTIIDGNAIDRIFHICSGGGCTNTVTFNDVTIQKGYIAGGGGGIRSEAGTTVVDGCHIRNNTAINGGGISNFATLIIQNGSLIGGSGAGNHSVIGNGGGIYNYAGTLTIDGSTISANSADNNGGGIWNQVTLNIQNGSTIGGSGVGNSAGNDGGGIHNYDGTTVIDNSNVQANSAINNGGGIWSQATLNVQNGSIIGGFGVGNTAGIDGGGVYNFNGTTTIDGSTISANSADNNGGGIWSHSTLNIQNGSTIGGPGVGNTAGIDGGGIYNWYLTTTIDSSSVQNNNATDGGGGVNNFATLIIQNGSTISANEAGLDGGGIRNSTVASTVIIQNGSVIGGLGGGNYAEYGGGILNKGTTTVDGSTISANSALYGGGIHNFETVNILNGSTIGGVGAGNVAMLHGGGIYTYAGTTTVDGSRILNNTASSNGGGVYTTEITSMTGVTNSCIVGNSVMSFYNNATTQQTATGNWWGAPTGPNTPGADTVLGNVDVSGFLTSPILNCAPDMQVNKSNNTGGVGTVGAPFNWTLTITNSGLIDADFAVGQKILEDDLPLGPIYGAPVAGNFVDITNSSNIDCYITGNKLTCEPTGGIVTLGAVTSSFEVTFSITPSAPVSLVNPAGVCQVDPDGNVIENDESNNNCPVDVVNVTAHAARLYLPLTIR